MPSAVVIGGGIGGLVIARDLAIGGLHVTLLEAGEKLGGKVASHTVAGIELDAGAESFANRGGTVAALAKELGLEVVPPLEGGAWLKPADGDPVPLPATSFLGIPGTPMAPDVVAVLGQRAALRAQLDELMLGQVGAREHTLGGLVRKRMGSAVLDRLVAPVVTGIHSKHPDELELDVVAPGIRQTMLRTGGSLAHAVRLLRESSPAGSAVSGIVGGVHRLAEAVATDLKNARGDIRLGQRVSGIEATGVTLESGERLDADLVVLATPLDADLAPTIALATLVVDSAELDAAPRGTGLLVAAGAPGIRAKALTHASAKWPWLAAELPAHRHVLRLSYNQPFPEGLDEQARRDAEALLGVPLSAENVVGSDVVTWPEVPATPEIPDGVTLVGESAAGTGLAAIVTQARREAERLLEGVAS